MEKVNIFIWFMCVHLYIYHIYIYHLWTWYMLGETFLLESLYSYYLSCWVWLLSSGLGQGIPQCCLLAGNWEMRPCLPSTWKTKTNKNKPAYCLLWKEWSPQTQCSCPIIQLTVYTGIPLGPPSCGFRGWWLCYWSKKNNNSTLLLP